MYEVYLVQLLRVCGNSKDKVQRDIYFLGHYLWYNSFLEGRFDDIALSSHLLLIEVDMEVLS